MKINAAHIAGAAGAALGGVLAGRAAAFRPEKHEISSAKDVPLDENKIVRDMSDLIRCKTVTYRDHSLEDRAEFDKLEALIHERFPKFHEAAPVEKLGRNGFLYHLKGEKNDKPTVLMAHYDVVPADETNWDKPAFEGIVQDGVLWGRGTLDTKGTFCSILEAAEYLIGEGWRPEQDMWFSFSGEEEIDGDTCKDIVSRLEELDVKPALVLDEGGAVVEGVFPGVDKSCALVGIGEKGSINLKFEMEGKGGHASTPPSKTLLGRLSQAVVNIEKHPFPGQYTKETEEMFDTLGREAGFGWRIIFANMWLFRPVIEFASKFVGGELNAMFRTTSAVTRMEGSPSYNVLPPNPFFGVNVRAMGTDTIDSVTDRLGALADDKDIRISLVGGMNPSITSDTSCPEYEKLAGVIRATWPEAVVSPYLMMACSDSRHYCRITDRVYRFSAMEMSKEERGMIHGSNEQIPIDKLIKTVQFYVRLMKVC